MRVSRSRVSCAKSSSLFTRASMPPSYGGSPPMFFEVLFFGFIGCTFIGQSPLFTIVHWGLHEFRVTTDQAFVNQNPSYKIPHEKAWPTWMRVFTLALKRPCPRRFNKLTMAISACASNFDTHLVSSSFYRPRWRGIFSINTVNISTPGAPICLWLSPLKPSAIACSREHQRHRTLTA